MTNSAYSLRFVLCGFLLLACNILGGSASEVSLEMSLAALALICLLIDVWFGPARRVWLSPALLICLVVVIPVAQLVPLPEQIWSELPQGHFVQALPDGAARSVAWPSLSVAPDRTLYSLIAAFPALVMFWLACDLSLQEQMRLANVQLISILAMALLGIVQATTGVASGVYKNSHLGVATGLFASRNNFADSLIIGVAMIFGLRSEWSKYFGRNVGKTLISGAFLLVIGACISSASRTGTALVLGTAFVSCLFSVRSERRGLVMIGSASSVVIGWLMVALIPPSGFLKVLLERFGGEEEARWDIWRTCFRIIDATMPWGVGIGNFRVTFSKFEAINSIIPAYVNAAHNEYLQLLIEAGFLGAVAAFAIAAFIAWRSVISLRTPLVPFATTALTAILIHGLDDYPFRVISGNVSIAYLCAIIIGARYAPKSAFRRMSSTSVLANTDTAYPLAIAMVVTRNAWTKANKFCEVSCRCQRTAAIPSVAR